MKDSKTKKTKELLEDFKKRRMYCNMKQEAPDRAPWRTRFGRGCGLIARQTTQ